jgi:hypothetical protein
MQLLQKDRRIIRWLLAKYETSGGVLNYLKAMDVFFEKANKK